jgi:hypothetical protein
LFLHRFFDDLIRSPSTFSTIDYRGEDREKVCGLRYDIGAITSLDYLFQKIPIIILNKRIVQPGDAFEDTSFKPGLKIVKFYTRF